MYQLYYTSRAKKDALKIKSANLKEKVAELLALISTDPLA
jgi:Txe/YoeB family toxin of Txe-Axe toxin-antitoxin module